MQAFYLNAREVHGVITAARAAPDSVLPLQQLQADDAHGRLAVGGVQVLRHAPDAVLFRLIALLPAACNIEAHLDIVAPRAAWLASRSAALTVDAEIV